MSSAKGPGRSVETGGGCGRESELGLRLADELVEMRLVVAGGESGAVPIKVDETRVRGADNSD